MRKIESPDPIDVQVGARIRIRRKVLSMSQSSLANSLSLTFQQVQKYERGTNRVSASTLVRIAQHLGTSVAALVGEDEAVPSETSHLRHMTKDGAPALLENYSKLSAEARKALLAVSAFMADVPK